MRFLFGVLIGGALTWAASLAVVDKLPSPGPAFRWLEQQLAPQEIVKTPPAVAVAVADDDVPEPRAMQPLPEPEPPLVEPSKPPRAVVQREPEPALPPREDPPVVATPQPSGWESAWVPFQTQRSASGFAQVLTRQVQHPFEVRREAVHRYRVTFAYADDAERERVLEAVRSVTGATP